MRKCIATAERKTPATKTSLVDPNWSAIPHHQMTPASRIAGVSEGSLYRAAEEGRLKLERHPIMLDHMRRSLRRRDTGGIRLA